MKDIALRSDFPIEVAAQMQFAKALAQAGVLPQHLRSQPANIMAIGMAARALDIPTWTALQQVVPIEGKTGLQADLMRALVLRAGHKFRVMDATPRRAEVVIVRSDDPDFEHRVVVEIDEIPDELKRKKNWQHYTADMLVARATSKACRRSCSDVLNGMIYTPEELGADVDEDGSVVGVSRATGEPDAAAKPLSDAAAKLRAAAESEAATADADDDVVDAEVVDDDVQPVPASSDPEHEAAVAAVDAEALPVPPETDAAVNAARQVGDGEFPESTHNDPFGEKSETPAAEQHWDRDVVHIGALRKSLIKKAAEDFGEDYEKALSAAQDGVPFDRITNDELRAILFEKQPA